MGDEALGSGWETEVRLDSVDALEGGEHGFTLEIVATGDPEDRVRLSPPRSFATAGMARAMALDAIAFHRRTGALPDLATDAFYEEAARARHAPGQ